MQNAPVPPERFGVRRWWRCTSQKAAGDLVVGQRVRTRQGGALTLRGKLIRVRPEPVYNLEVAAWHTYFAGAAELLAHNKCDRLLTELVEVTTGIFKKRLKPNTSYIRNGYEYATGAFGRIRKAAGDLRLEAGTAFAAADVSMALSVGIDAGVAVAHPPPANQAVVVGHCYLRRSASIGVQGLGDGRLGMGERRDDKNCPHRKIFPG